MVARRGIRVRICRSQPLQPAKSVDSSHERDRNCLVRLSSMTSPRKDFKEHASGHTKLTFGRRVPRRCNRAAPAQVFQGGICDRDGFAAGPHELLPVGPRTRASRATSHRFARRSRPSRTSGDSRLGWFSPTSPNSVDFRRCRMPGLPMLNERRGSEGTETKPPRSTRRQPRPRC